MVSIYVNDNKDYIFSFTLNKNFNTKKLTSEGGVTDPTIMKKVEERDKNDWYIYWLWEISNSKKRVW